MKRVAAAVLGLVAAAHTLAREEDGDIYARVRRLLGPSGERADSELRKGNFARVEDMLRASSPAAAAARSELLSAEGAVAFLAGKMNDALADFDAAAAIAPLSDADTFTRAMALVNLGDDAQARTSIEGLSERHPDQAVYLYWLGRIDYDQRRYLEATVKLKKAVALDPRSSRCWNSLALALDMQGEMDQALDAFGKAVELNRTLPHPSPWPTHDMGFLLLRMEKTSEAEAALRESLRYNSSLAQTHYYLGRVLEKEGQSGAAIEQYKTAVFMDGKSPEPCYSLAKLYRALGRGPDAEKMFAEYKIRKGAIESPSDH